MYGDGDSETESDSNMINNNGEEEDEDILEVNRDAGDENMHDQSTITGKCSEKYVIIEKGPNLNTKLDETVSEEEKEEYDNEIENMFEKEILNPPATEDEVPKPKLENQFSDNFIDIFKFDESHLTEGEQELDAMKMSSDGSNSSSDSGRRRVYAVNLLEDEINISICEEISEIEDVDSEDSESGEDIFFSSEDVMKNFVDLDDSNKIISEDENGQTTRYFPNLRICDKISEASEEESRSLISIENVDVENLSTERLQVDKHLLKFELSKQLFELGQKHPIGDVDGIDLEPAVDEEDKKFTEIVPFYTKLHPNSNSDKLKMNEELFASLFDYELKQVEEIKAGLSILSHTLTKSNLLKLEQDLYMKRSFSFNDVFPPKTIKILHRSTSEPIFEAINEDEINSQSSSSSTSDVVQSPIRPILKKKSLVSLSSHSSQTDITALEGGCKIVSLKERNSTDLSRYSSDPGLTQHTELLPKRSHSVSFLLPPSEYTISKLFTNREYKGSDSDSLSLLTKPFTSQSGPSVNLGSFYDQIPIPEKSRFEEIQTNKESTIKSYDNLSSVLRSLKEHGMSSEKKKSNTDISMSRAKSPVLNPETLLGDISFLNQFKDKMVTKDNLTPANQEVCGRYSLIDRDLHTVDTTSHVITELWKLPAGKNLNCLFGNMESCEDDIVIGEENETNKAFTRQQEVFKTVLKTDYRDYLVPDNTETSVLTQDRSQSEGDTDDLIEDARNFVRAAQIKIVDDEDWKEIDNKRRKRRLTRKERDKLKESKMMESDGEENEVDSAGIKSSEPYLPRRISDLKVGYPVRVISAAGSKISPGVVRFLGYVDGAEKVGVELKENLGDCDGGSQGRFYFKCNIAFKN